MAVLTRGCSPWNAVAAFLAILILHPQPLHRGRSEWTGGRCLYLPNGNPAPGPKFDYKLRWFERLISYAQLLLGNGAPSVLCGDYNVVPTPIDAVVPRRWLGDAVAFSREFGRHMLECSQDGWIDVVRRIHPEKGIYTYWNFSYRGGYDRSSGLRMDHLLVSPSLTDKDSQR